jgi:hypothetical protein
MKKILVIFLIQSILFSFINAQEKIQSKVGQEYKTEFNILYRDKTKESLTEYMESRCRLDVYYPVNEKSFATVIWFHGGGLLSGEKYIPENLKNRNIAVIPVNYRFSPQVKCPAYIEDAAAAVAWVFNNIHKYNGDPDKIYVSGHSAGGYLTLMVGLDKKWLGLYGIDANRIAGLFPFSGQTVTHSTIRRERGISEQLPVIDEFAPINHGRNDAPPLWLIAGDRALDIGARYAENAYMLEIMKLVGNKTTSLHELQGFDHMEMVEPACYVLLKSISQSIDSR